MTLVSIVVTAWSVYIATDAVTTSYDATGAAGAQRSA